MSNRANNLCFNWTMNKIVKKTISDYTRKRGNAQGVARPACAIAIVYFLTTIRLAMLLPPSE